MQKIGLRAPWDSKHCVEGASNVIKRAYWDGVGSWGNGTVQNMFIAVKMF